MKIISLLVVLFAGAAFQGLGQDAKGGQVLAEAHAVTKETKKVPVTPPKPGGVILGKRVEYGGYFTEVLRAEKKRPLFSLKAPIDPEKDLENLSFYPGTNHVQGAKVQGIILFSIKF